MSDRGPWGQPPAPRRQGSRLGWALWLGTLAGLAGMIWGLSVLFPNSRDDMDTAWMLRTAAVVAMLSSGLLFVRQVNLKQAARNILLWLGVATVLILGFAYQDRLLDAWYDLRSRLVPSYPVATASHEMTLSESEGGGYAVYGSVNGVTMRFQIDTGASDIVLNPGDARKLGLDFAQLKFDQPYGTANGTGYGAHVTVDRLRVGGITLRNVPVSVNGAEMGTSLLGMSFLRRLKSFTVGEGKMVLRW